MVGPQQIFLFLTICVLQNNNVKVHGSTIVWLHHLDLNEKLAEKYRWMLPAIWKKILEAALHKTATYYPYHKSSKKGLADTLGTGDLVWF